MIVCFYPPSLPCSCLCWEFLPGLYRSSLGTFLEQIFKCPFFIFFTVEQAPTLEDSCRTRWDNTHGMCSINVRFYAQKQNPAIILERIKLSELQHSHTHVHILINAWPLLVRIKWDNGEWRVVYTVKNSLTNKMITVVREWGRKTNPLIFLEILRIFPYNLQLFVFNSRPVIQTGDLYTGLLKNWARDSPPGPPRRLNSHRTPAACWLKNMSHWNVLHLSVLAT